MDYGAVAAGWRFLYGKINPLLLEEQAITMGLSAAVEVKFLTALPIWN